MHDFVAAPLAAGVALYLLCWAATWWWGSAVVKRQQAERLQAELDESRSRYDGHVVLQNVTPHYRIEKLSVPAPFVVNVGYSITHGFHDARVSVAVWLWLPWEAHRLSDQIRWVT